MDSIGWFSMHSDAIIDSNPLVESPEQDSNFTSNVSTLNAGKGGGTRRISSGTGT